MNRTLIVVGVILALIWLGVTLISLGLPHSVCDVLKNITFGICDRAVSNMQNGFYYDVPNSSMPIVAFLILFSAAFFLYLLVSLRILKVKPGKSTFLIIIFFSILFRLLLVPSVPVHENDFYRYLWDGKVFNSGINPYKYAPGDLEALGSDYSQDYFDMDKGVFVKVRSFSDGDKKQLGELEKLRGENPVYFDRIGHRWVPTIYPPAAQAVFALSSLARKDSVVAFKLIVIVFDLAVFFLIALMLVLLGKNPSFSIIYGWSPLVLKEFSNSAHYDSVAIFFTLLFIYFILRNQKIKGAITLAMAALAKFFPILIAFVNIKRMRWKYLLFSALLAAIFYIPFFLWNSTGIKQVFNGLRIYSALWVYNGSIFVVFNSVLSIFIGNADVAVTFAKFLSASFLICIVAYLMKRDDDNDSAFLHKSFLVLVALFLLSPVAHPWYYCAVIPFLCIFPYRSFILLSWLLIFSYLSFSRDLGMVALGPVELPILNLVQYVPFFVFLALETWSLRGKPS